MNFRIWTLLVVAGCSLVGIADVAEAGPISPQNPFRSYNLSGINYGSQQWERDHARLQGKSPAPAPQSNRIIFRRRHLRR
ncbi:MAG: hypothetical protein JSS49_01640 [Planctomycetes bacterium]|nr:hypothetical protein [Planctomycetota bacterium]